MMILPRYDKGLENQINQRQCKCNELAFLSLVASTALSLFLALSLSLSYCYP